MRRPQLELALSEIARVTGLREVVVIGSQAIHAMTDAAPPEVLMSFECDVLLDEDDPMTHKIDDEIGPTSRFFAEHGVFVDTVSSTFPFLPEGWTERLRTIDVGPIQGRCLEVHDLVLSKLAAGRLKDFELIATLLDRKLIELEVVRERITIIADPHLRAVLLARLQIVLESKDR